MGLFDALGVTAGTNKDIGQTSYQQGNTDIQLNPWQKFLGATEEKAENSRLKAQQKDLQERFGGQLALVGSTGVDWGETEQQVMAKIARLKTERDTGQSDKAVAQSLKVQQEGQKPQMAQIAAGVKAQEAQTTLLREQMLQQAREANLTRAENAEVRADNLALQRLQMEREDQRYNERMEQLDRRDRKQGRQSLVAGLAALGAAFAL